MEAAKRLALWEISDALTEIGEKIADGGGELTPELEAQLDAMEGAFEEKAERIALFVKECEANAVAAHMEATRLSAIARHFETKASGLKDYLLAAMNRSGRTSVKTHRARIWTQKNGRPSIRYAGNIDALPPEYIRTKTMREVDTQYAYVEHQAGAKLPDGFIVDHGTHLRIG